MAKKFGKGILEITSRGNGFLRNPKRNFRTRNDDPYLSRELIHQHQLKEGLHVRGELGKPSQPKQSAPLQKILKINGKALQIYSAHVANSEAGVSIDPEEKLVMCTGPKDITGRAIDLLTPIGKGQRGMIISPPKAGKTTILKHIAQAVHQNHPKVQVIVLLIDERPEEVTDFRRELEGAEVFYSSADQDVESHLRMTSLTMNMARRRMELGLDVVVLIDSLTRMARAFNKDAESGSKTLSGGLAANAMELPRQFFGAARNIENGGSLTIMATILVQTGSRMDEVIFQEFKGTGNLDLVLSRECADRRLFPAIDIRESGTRKEHKLLSSEDLEESNYLRRKTVGMKTPEALQYCLENLLSN